MKLRMPTEGQKVPVLVGTVSAVLSYSRHGYGQDLIFAWLGKIALNVTSRSPLGWSWKTLPLRGDHGEYGSWTLDKA